MALTEAASAPYNAPYAAANAPAAASAVSWGAIVAGASAAAALSMILLVLGTGLGLSSISPWAQRGIGAAAFGISTIVWVTVTQILSSGMGGYLAGRLRTKWVAVHSDEAYFRDTAHGFLAWAVASLATAALLGSVISAVVGSGLQAGASVAAGAATAAMSGGAAMVADKASEKPGGASGSPATGPMNYFIDSLFRQEGSAPAAAATAASATEAMPVDGSNNRNVDSNAQAAEVARIFLNSVQTGALPADDQRYVGQLVARRTGLSPADAEKRVGDTYARVQAKLQDAAASAQQAADKARKATIYATLWLFVAMLTGAFSASLAATVGGRQRDL